MIGKRVRYWLVINAVLSNILCAPYATGLDLSLQGDKNLMESLPEPRAEDSSDDVAHNIERDFDKLKTKGFVLPIPGAKSVIDPDPDGLRSKLFDQGLGYWGYTNNKYLYDIRNGNMYDGKQVYSGQRPTYASFNFLFFSYDLEKYGIEDGQIAASLILAYSSWNSGGPSKTSVGLLQFHKSFLNKKLELTLGNLGNDYAYTGIYVGGNLASGTFGVSANIPAQAGMSTILGARPGANLRFNIKDGFYNQLGVQRSTNPLGAVEEEKANPNGLTWHGKHVGTIVIDEIGYKRPAAEQRRDAWFRVGYIENSSRYNSRKIQGQLITGTHAGYVMADRQITNSFPSAGSWQRGFYLGASAMYAPADVNLFSKYYELRLYGKGVAASRPGDMLSFVVAKTSFSKYTVRNALNSGELAENDSLSIAASYTMNVLRGCFLTSGLNYVSHPRPAVTSQKQESGLIFASNLIIYF